ncbi:polysaccharide deacetylase family protein [Devosia sp.]|uniref:polysaccharide deacetylase family protein n=1 Tax=Devosia sp. TaxID=1871048 RepID=UPI00326705FA
MATDHSMVTGSVMRTALPITAQSMPAPIVPSGRLAGRTLAVATAADIQLRHGEVVLTFDDGPRPGRTDAILATLDDFGVKATFMMLGNAARAHPQTVQAVALQGHTIGSHTYDHADLSTLTQQAAMTDISRGQDAVAAALAPIGKQPAPFFRFPYLAQTGFLRTSLFRDNAVVLDVNIDSKDYYKDTPEQVLARTLARLDARGSGIILFHDIQARTVTLMPMFLKALEDRGYSVVRLVPKTNGPFGIDVITAEAPVDLRGAY